ncbi:MAG: hypothetical protein M3539_04340, partial [Acidobacteriota bacterium]|nr:hypothetical protein [Acidobacteriota bacterium]
WGLGFFIVVNRAVQAERSWIAKLKQPRLITSAAVIGVFSYSLYLTHELVIMQSWKFSIHWLPPIINTLLVTVPATVAFAWVFYRFCEKPYMRKAVKKVATTEEHRVEELTPVFGQRLPAVADEA